MATAKEKILGIILCGGQSQRMGADKGLLTSQKKTWAENAVDKMKALNIPVKISVNKKQYASYAEIFSTDNLIVDDDSLLLKGPLLGVLSCHLTFPKNNLFVLACDMPLMETSMLQLLYKKHEEQTADAYIFINDGDAEPLCGIYTSEGLSVIPGMLKKGTLVKHSMKFMLEQLMVNSIALQEEEKKYCRNFNSQSELSV